MNKIEEILSAAKLDELKGIAKVGDLLSKKEADEKKKTFCKAGLIVAGVVILAGIALAVYKYLSKDTMDDFDDFDDFDDDFEDDFEDFDDECEDFVDETADTVMDKAEEAVEAVKDAVEE